MSEEIKKADVSEPQETKRPRGSGAKAKSNEKFRRGKNSDFCSDLKVDLLRKLKISDPTRLSAVPLCSAVIPARIPISFIGVTYLTMQLWSKMLSVAARTFGMLIQENPDAYCVFYKCILHLCQIKLAYAHMTVPGSAHFPLSQKTTFDEMALRVAKDMAAQLPYPIALLIESIGHFQINMQNIVPVAAKSARLQYGAGINYMLTSIISMVQRVTQQPVDINNPDLLILRDMNLPGFIVQDEQNQAQIAPQSYALWSVPPTARERTVFKAIISTFSFKRGFNLLVDISTGSGSSVQLVRFPEIYNPDESSVKYYLNTSIPVFEEKLAPALMLGQEYETSKQSMYCSSYDDCFKRGQANQEEATSAIVWVSIE